MAYTKNNWVDNETTITANALNNIEAGIETVTNEASNIVRDFARKTYVNDEITKVKTSNFYEHINVDHINIPKDTLDKRFKFDFPVAQVIKHKGEYYTYIFKNTAIGNTDTVEGLYKINKVTNTIELVKAYTTDKHFNAVMLYNDGKIYLFAGRLKGKTDGSNSFYCYDFVTNEFTKLPDITIEQNINGLRCAYAYNNKLYLCGVFKYFNNQSSRYDGAIIYDTITKQWSKNDSYVFTDCENVSVSSKKILVFKTAELAFDNQLKCNALRVTVEELSKDIKVLSTRTFDLSAKEAQYLPDYYLPISETKFFSVASYCNGREEGATGWYKQETVLFDLNNADAKFQVLDDQIFDILPNKTFNGDYKVGICQEDLSIFLHTLENGNGNTISNGIYHVCGKATNYTSNECKTTEEALDTLFDSMLTTSSNVSTIYVDYQKGSDTNDGTIGRPYKTVEKAHSVSTRKNVIRICGQYNNSDNTLVANIEDLSNKAYEFIFDDVQKIVVKNTAAIIKALFIDTIEIRALAQVYAARISFIKVYEGYSTINSQMINQLTMSSAKSVTVNSLQIEAISFPTGTPSELMLIDTPFVPYSGVNAEQAKWLKKGSRIGAMYKGVSDYTNNNCSNITDALDKLFAEIQLLKNN